MIIYIKINKISYAFVQSTLLHKKGGGIEQYSGITIQKIMTKFMPRINMSKYKIVIYKFSSLVTKF